MATATSWRDRLSPHPETVQWAALLVNVELALLLVYAFVLQPQFGTTFQSPLDWRYAIYPFVWINVGLWAVWRTRPAPTTTRRRALAAGIAVAYFGILAYAGGLVSLGGSGFQYGPYFTLSLPPGYSPALQYSGEFLRLVVMPYNLVGYLALAYLVYATVIDAAGSAISGVLGLLSCVSCTWPVLASLATGIFGGASALATATMGYSYGISTVVFVVTVGLLYWRPTVR